MIQKLSGLCDECYAATNKLEADMAAVPMEDILSEAEYYKDVILPDMDAVRAPADEMEQFCDEDVWPFPTYGKLLFSV